MDGNGGLGMRNWGEYFEQPQRKGGLSLQLVSAGEREPRPFLSSGAFLHRDCSVQEPSIPTDYMREGWIYPCRDNNKMLHVTNPKQVAPFDAHSAGSVHTIQMLKQSDPAAPKEGEKAPAVNVLRKRSRGINSTRAQKPDKPKKASAQRGEGISTGSASALPVKGGKRCSDVVINGLDLDISRLPTPICSCTGTPQQCYRWGLGGWQSACCTNEISMYPLPMNTKRQGTRIPGRKMSHGAFKKVLEKLVGEGYNLSSPIDLRGHWAKHGTNKFVTIR